MRHYIVVYQYGKVASTSLVASLNALPDVEAVQAHFLGCQSLREMVSLIVDPAIPEYFHRHQIGQFVENARTTRIVNAFRQGRETGNALTIISLYRDPFEWFRSSILQDIVGYLPALRRVPLDGEVTDEEETRVRRALEWMLGAFSSIVRDFGGIDALVDPKVVCGRELAEQPILAENRELLAMFYMMLRPFSWFNEHYRPAIGCTLDDFVEIDTGMLYRKTDWASLFVLRYEDLDSQVQRTTERLGIGPIDALVSENVSDTKGLFEPVRDAFVSAPAKALKAQFAATEYARRFGYA